MKKVLTLCCVLLAGCLSSGEPSLQLISGAGAPYPPEARAAGLEGFVVVRYDVDESGRVINLSVVESAPQGIFDQAALKAVSAWRYNPPLADGQARTVRGVNSRVEFKLGNGDEYRNY